MSVAPALVRVRAIRQAEEEQCRNALDVAVSNLHRLQVRIAAVKTRLDNARSLLASSILIGAAEDRLAALHETSALNRLAQILHRKLEDAELRLLRTRNQFLAKRIERRQVETLLQAARLQAAVEQNRKNQSSMDEWFRMRSLTGPHPPEGAQSSLTSRGADPDKTVPEI